MLTMILYAISIMYTPGPINLLGMNEGLSGRYRQSMGYFVGVGLAMLTLFLLYGYTGEQLLNRSHLIYISAIGSAYILYLAYKIFRSGSDYSGKNNSDGALTLKDGYFMQIMNPKATLATLPIATINYPANNIEGISILFVSIILAIMAGNAPHTYSFFGSRFGKVIEERQLLKWINFVMAALLVYVSVSIIREHVYLVIRGVNAY